MGPLYADIELINSGDIALARRNYIGEEEIKRIQIRTLVKSGTYMLAINENIQQQLQLPVIEKRKAQLANGQLVECDVVGPVQLKFKNRQTICQAIVLPGDSEPQLGSIPLGDLDVQVDPIRQEFIVNPEHPYFAQMKMK